jgi:hypothetical protein
MKERGIVMSGSHPVDILEGRKTMTRRVMNPQIRWLDSAWYYQNPRYDNGDGVHYFHSVQITPSVMELVLKCCPYGQVGDGLWVRETWWQDQSGGCWAYKADGGEWPVTNCGGQSKSSRFMPRWASRILLEITELKVERLQDIDNHDSWREGIPEFSKWPSGLICHNPERIEKGWGLEARDCFAHLWDSLNAKRGYSWDSNPWVWVIGFCLLSPVQGV